MFSAISSYFFGAGKVPPAETPVEYDIKEDDEWMLVDVSGDKENVPETVSGEPEGNIIEGDDNVDEDANNDWERDDEDETFEHVFPLPNLKDQTFSFLKLKHPLHLSLDSSWAISSLSSFTDCSGQNFIQNTAPTPNDSQLVSVRTELANMQQYRMRFMARTMMRLKGTKVLYDVVGSATPADLLMKLKDIVTRGQEATENATPLAVVKSEARTNLHMRRTPLEQKTPIKLPKKEYMQQIQELIPTQQVKEYESKKYLKKAQLNRKNRVSMYESSNKNRHRRDLWQHHSGANNNRKCY